MDAPQVNRSVAQAERLAIVVADTIGKLPPSALVRSLMALDADELVRLGNALRSEQASLRRAGIHPDVARDVAWERFEAQRAEWRRNHPSRRPVVL